MDLTAMYSDLGKKGLDQIASENRLTREQLINLWDQAGLTGRQPNDPSPAEILAGLKKIQSQWTEEQRSRRWIAARLINRRPVFAYMEGR